MHFEAGARLGVSIARYARERGVSAHALHAARQAMKSLGTRRACVPKAKPRLLPVRVSAPSPGLSAQLHNGIDEAQALRTTDESLRHVDCLVLEASFKPMYKGRWCPGRSCA